MRRGFCCRLAGLAVLVAAGLTGACSAKASLAPPPATDATAELLSAGELLRAGCFDCLAEARRMYDVLGARPGLSPMAADEATAGAVRALVLLAFRARELGIPDGEYLARARQDVEAHADLAAKVTPLLDAVELMPSLLARFDRPPDLAAMQRLQAFRTNLPAFLAELRRRPADDPVPAYAWLAVTCGLGSYEDQTAALKGPLPDAGATGLAFRRATCRGADAPAVQAVLDREPRFAEINFFLGQQAVARRELEEAEVLFRRAYQWRAEWPAVTLALANLYFAFEEPERALAFYEQTLTLAPGVPDAMLGRVKSLSVLKRHDDAFAAIEPMLNGPARVLPGEAYYWRAWNDVQVERIDDAWTDVEEAHRLWANSEVAKLAGIVAHRRGDFTAAEQRFDVARTLNDGDCETVYYLGLVHAAQRAWARGADDFAAAAQCLDRVQRGLRDDVDGMRQSSLTQERKARSVARLQEQLATAGRRMKTSWFNAAVANFNQEQFGAARSYADRVADDEEFGERTRELLKRMGPR